jgi:putative oxidoreductase
MNVDLALLVLRVAVGIVIMAHGLLKLGWVGKGGSIAGVAGWFNGLGFRPGLFWAWVSVLAEAGGGLLTILGLGGPIGPSVVAADLVVVTIVAHVPKGFWAHEGGWEFPVAVAAGAFAIALIGNGRWSLDAALGLSIPDRLAIGWGALLAAGVLLALALHAVAPKPKPA